MPLTAELTVAGPISPEELKDLRAAVQAAGLAAAEPNVIRRRGAAETAIAITLTVPLAEFLKANASSAGADTYSTLKRLVTRVLDARRDDSRLTLEDAVAGTTVSLSATLPPVAFDALRDLDFAAVPAGDLVWDRRAGRWLAV